MTATIRNVTLGEVCTRIGDGIHGTPEFECNGEYCFFNGSNICDGFLVEDKDTKRVNNNEYIKYAKELNENSLLLSINGTIGNVAKYHGEKCILGKSAAYLNVNADVNPSFIYYVLKSTDFKNILRMLTEPPSKTFH